MSVLRREGDRSRKDREKPCNPAQPRLASEIFHKIGVSVPGKKR
jgi:hypothetical protein